MKSYTAYDVDEKRFVHRRRQRSDIMDALDLDVSLGNDPPSDVAAPPPSVSSEVVPPTEVTSSLEDN